MPFSQATITDGPRRTWDDLGWTIFWSSSSPVGTTFQAYLNGQKVYAGTDLKFVLPDIPVGSVVQVGTVGSGEGNTDFSSSLPTVPGRQQRPYLTWYGGRYEDPDLAGFHVYQSTVAGGSIGTTLVATVSGTSAGVWLDGFGRGRFGKGGFGYAEISYTWTGEFLAGGVWTFQVNPYDNAGNEGAGTTTTLTVNAAPNPPTIGDDGKRMRLVSYNATTRVAVLGWNASV